MAFLTRLFRRSPALQHPRPQNVSIYYDAQRVLILTACFDKRTFAVHGAPMAILAKDASPRQIGEQVLQSLAASRYDLEDDEAKSMTDQMLQRADLRSIDEFDSKFDLIFISRFAGEDITVAPMHRYKEGGHGEDVWHSEPPPPQFPADPDQIGQFISDIINRPPPPVLSADENEEDEEERTESTSTAAPAGTEKYTAVNAELKAGDRVRDLFGHLGTVIMTDPNAEHGLGTVQVRFDDGRVVTLSFVAHGLALIRHDHGGAEGAAER